MLYELFTHQKAHQGKTAQRRMGSMLSEDPKPAESHLIAHHGRVPREVSVVLKRMLERAPEDRFETREDLVKAWNVLAEGNIPVICPHTAVKKGFWRLGRVLDTHNLWLTPIVIVWLAYPLSDLIPWLLSFF